MKINIHDVIRLKKRGYSNEEIGKKFHVTPQSIFRALQKAKEKGLWNGESGTEVHNYEKYLESAKTSKTVGRPLTREEWNSLWEKKCVQQPKEKGRELLEDGSLKPKPFPKHRCLNKKCRTPLTPLKEVYFIKGHDKVREQLISQGYTHICLKCLRVYEKESLEESGFVCAECGNDVVEVSYKGMTLYHCKKCRALYDKDELKKETEAERTE